MVHLSPQGFHNRSFTIRPLQYFLLIVLLTGSATVALAQSRQTDSLSRLIATAPHDTLKCRILSLIAESEGDDNIWPLYNKQLLDLAESNLSKPTTAKNPLLHRTYSRFKADALNNVGFLHYVQGQFDKALEFYYRSLDIREKINDQTGIASSLSNIGVIYQNQGKMNKVMEVYERGLAIQKKVGDKRGAGISLNNIGFLHLNQGDIAKALDYFRQTLSLQEELGNKDLQAGALNNIGKALETQNENEEALRMFEKGKKLHQEANN
ncbi:MAG: Tetratricopeptide 2, partial [Bacteroidetes bacterium]|nr:Tetratricopeptide 2 [Bacteroidota bacterium]